MDMHEKKVELFKKYCNQLATTYGAVDSSHISDRQWKNATNKFAHGAKRDAVIGLFDATIASSGKSGYLFTDTKVYYLDMLEKPKKLWYDEIKRVDVINNSKSKDCERTLRFIMKDGSSVEWTSKFLKKTSLCAFFRELLALEISPAQKAVITDGSDKQMPSVVAAGLGAGSYGTVNKLYDEEKFHARQGHGFAAERANHLYDKMTRHKAKILGDDNAKNGADRIVDGVYIQSKYCATGTRCVNECFEENGKGLFRYMLDGKPMQIEVPSDSKIYDDAVRTMEDKIKNGQVPGVTDPKEAKEIVRKGHFTYTQAKNIAKAGTVESLTYDAVSGAVIATSAFGVTAAITFASALWNGEDFDVSLKRATWSGLKVGGTAFITSLLSSQFLKAGLNHALVNSSEAVVRLMGPKASAVLINAFRTASKPIYGAAAMKSAAKLLRGNVVTAGVSVAVLSTVDIANIFRRRISGKQLFKNLANTTGTVAGGTLGWMAGAAAGSAIAPGAGTIIGGLLGSLGLGGVAGKATNAATGIFMEDDADEMVRILQTVFETVANEYLLSQSEAEKCVDRLGERLNGRILKDMYASKNRNAFARDLIIPIVEACVASRDFIAMPSDDEMLNSLRELLEDIADGEVAMA